MRSTKVLLPAFILTALVQLYVPASMIWSQEDVLNTGTAYKFKTAPIDPNDPFRGKYINLSFDNNSIQVANAQDWTPGEAIYAFLATDEHGFAIIESVTKEKPDGDQGFLKATVLFASGNGSDNLVIDYPFNRFYMEESKAPDAEIMYRESQVDTTKTTYALVYIKDGEAVLKDVLIDGVPIRDLVKEEENE